MKNIVVGIAIAFFVFGMNLTVAGQNPRDTTYSPDKTLRSNATVNPSTLAMELTIPISRYAGRAGTGLPLAFNYSSKVWEMKHSGAWPSQLLGTKTSVMPTYGKRSAAGWTSTLGTALIDYKFNWYRDASPDGADDYTGVLYNPQPWQEDSMISIYYVKSLQVTLPDGSSHEFRTGDLPIMCGNVNYGCNVVDQTGTYLSVDGLRMRLEVGNSGPVTLFMPNGDRYIFPAYVGGSRFDPPPAEAHTFIDRNGNKMSYNGSTRTWTDTLGRTLTGPFGWNWSGGSGHTEGTQTKIFPGLNGQNYEVDLSWSHLKDPDGTNHALENPNDALRSLSDRYCQGSIEHTVTGPYLFGNLDPYTRICGPGFTTQGPPFNPVVLTKVELPNGQKYEFRYNVYGEITKIVYPSGGYERFEYAEITALQPGNMAYDRANRGVVKRWVSASGEGTDEVLWEYSAVLSGSWWEPIYKIVTKAPDGTSREQYLHTEDSEAPRPFGNGSMLTGRPYEERIYAAGSPGALLSRNLTTYDQTAVEGGIYPGQWQVPINVRAVRSISIEFEPANAGALATMTETVYDTAGSTDPAYFSSLNAKQVKKYGYVAVSASTAASASAATAAGWFSSATPAAVTETDYLYDADYKARNIVGLATETRVKDGSGTVRAKTQFAYDEPGYQLASAGTMPTAAAGSWEDPADPNGPFGATVGGKRGLPTTVRSYHDVANSLYIETHAFYDQYGNVRKSRDGRGNDTVTGYDEDYAFAYPTGVTTPIPDPTGTHGSNVALTTSTDYDYNTGLPTSSTDANLQTTTMEYADPLQRPTKVTLPNGHETVTEYGAGTSPSTRWVKVITDIDATNTKYGLTYYDGLGRTWLTQSEDSQGDVFAITCYDQMGRIAKTSNPFRGYSAQTCASTTGMEWTTPGYDAAGRQVSVTTPDGAVVTTAYSLAMTGGQIGSVVTVTDQAGKLRRSVTNALGQLVRVDEPTTSGLGSIPSPNQATLYEYDTLGNLITVTQGVQTRNFAYDALSRLKQATNPESETIKYTYDENGNLKTKWDARGIKTIYDYDALGRVWKRCYKSVGTSSLGAAASCAAASGETAEPNTPDVAYFYDNLANAKGKLTKVSSSVSATEYTAFDILGRVTGHKQTTDGVAYTTAYAYSLSGALVEQTYPSGRVVKNTFDAADGSLSQVQSKRSSETYRNFANGFVYNAAGAVTAMKLGNGRWENTTFNSRLQPTRIGLGAGAYSQSLLKLEYEYGATASVNNGNVTKQTITVPGAAHPFVQNYTYDESNRLKIAEESHDSTQTWKQTFTFDRYGNRNFDEANTTFAGFDKLCGGNTILCSDLKKRLNPSINTSNNRLSTSDDYAFDPSGNTTSDADDRMFVYDAENKQVEIKDSLNASIGQYFYDGDGKRVKKVVPGGETTVFVYDAGGKLIGEYSTVVQTGSNAKTVYTTNDHLGSPRINTDATGQVISRHDYHPFGEEVSRSGYGSDTIRKQFTSYERDNETDLDFAQARMYGYSHGRFTSPDDFLNDTHVSDPQSWNLYVYVRNNPLRLIDPTGEEIEKKDGKVRFDSDGKVVTATVETATRKVIVNGKEETRTVTVKAKFTEGKIYSVNNGKRTEIQAYQSAGALEVIETNEKGETVFSGTVEKYEEFSGVTEFRGWNNTSNCHGTTFANGEVWIQNNQVEKLMKAEGYDTKNPSSTPTAGAVGIFSTDGKLNDPRHSVRVLSLNPTTVESKGGVTSREVTTPAKSWTDTDPSRKNHKLLYYTQKVTK